MTQKLTTVGWCAGRPADHNLSTEANTAARFLLQWPRTSALRDFRGDAVPAPNWWTTQSCAAFDTAYENGLIDSHSVDVAFSWERVQGQPLAPLLGTRPNWVRRTILLGVHEPHARRSDGTPKRTPTDFYADMKWIRNQVGASMDPYDDDAIVVTPAMILYRARNGSEAELDSYLEPLIMDHVIDAIMWDGYPSKPGDKPSVTAPADYEDPRTFSATPRMYAEGSGLPYGWTELNFGRVPSDTDGRRRAAWHEALYRQAQADNALTVMHFTYNQADWLAREQWAEVDRWGSVIREVDTARQAYESGIESADGREDGYFEAGFDAALERVQPVISAAVDGLRRAGPELGGV